MLQMTLWHTNSVNSEGIVKRYKRKTPLLPQGKLAVLTALFAIATLISGSSNDALHYGCMIIGCMLLITELFVSAGAAGRYRYADGCIELLWLSFRYKKINYSDLGAIAITSAIYNNNYGHGINREIPMHYLIESNAHQIAIPFPFILLLSPQYPFDSIRGNTSSRDLYLRDPSNSFCLGICWPDSLDELLKHSSCMVYITKDIYSKYKCLFDDSLAKCTDGAARVHVIESNPPA